MNKLIVTGNLVRQTDITYTQSGIQIGRNTIASNRQIKRNGNAETKTCFIDFVVFGKTAEVLKDYTRKGSKILAEGWLDYNTWTDKNGINRSKLILQIERIELLDTKKDNNQQQTQSNQQPTQNAYPAQQQSYQTQYQQYPIPNQQNNAPYQQNNNPYPPQNHNIRN